MKNTRHNPIARRPEAEAAPLPGPSERLRRPAVIAWLLALLLATVAGCGGESSASDGEEAEATEAPEAQSDLSAGRIVWAILPGDRLQPLLDDVASLLDGSSGPKNVRKIGGAPRYMSVGDRQVFEFPVSYKFSHARLRIELIIESTETIDIRFMSDSNLTGAIDAIADEYKKQWQYEQKGPVNLGTYRVTVYDPISKTRFRIEFYLEGETVFDEPEEFKEFMDRHGRTVEERVMIVVRNCTSDAFAKNGQKKLARRLVVAVNRAVGREFLKSAEIKGLSVYESYEGSGFVKRKADDAPPIQPFEYHEPEAASDGSAATGGE
jgi:hypothetical protein